MKTLSLLCLLILSFTNVSCQESKTDSKAQTTTISDAKKENFESKNFAIIQTIHGNITFKFYDQDAPNTTKRIKELISQKFYDGIIFHRVVPGFVVQGGDPTGTGTSGSGKKLKAEFNSKKHILGTVAMARAADPDSADSQFYICLGEFQHLDNNYTVFGQVTEGIDVVKKIRQGDKMISVTLK